MAAHVCPDCGSICHCPLDGDECTHFQSGHCRCCCVCRACKANDHERCERGVCTNGIELGADAVIDLTEANEWTRKS